MFSIPAMMGVQFFPIGVIRTPFKEFEGMPIQPVGAKGVKGQVVIDPGCIDGLKDIEGFSHIILLYHFHQSDDECSMLVEPYLDSEKRGVFATRSPSRPNPIGMSVVKLEKIEENVLHVANVDMLDETPLLDIKPYVPKFNHAGKVKLGWLEGKISEAAKAKI